MKEQFIKIGIPSKGRLKDKSLSVFKKNNINIKKTKRSYLSEVKNLKNIEIVFSHAREIIERLSDGSLDLGISGFDLLNESLPGIKKTFKLIDV